MKPHQADFNLLLAVLRKQAPARPVLFELFMNMPLYERVNGERLRDDSPLGIARFTVRAFHKMGYDYATLHASSFHFAGGFETKHTRSLNANAGIRDERSFEAFAWPDPDAYSTDLLDEIKSDLPQGMRLMVMGPGGVLENVIELVGYENLCLMLYDNPELAGRVFDAVGSRLVRYYELALQHEAVGLISSNDDWGFNSQPFLSPAMMRKYVFPWHQRIVDTVHRAGRPVFLHSCGNLNSLMDEVIAMGYDAKHSFEDNIQPIEQAYEAYAGRIALLGGLDMNYLCTRPEDEIYRRTLAMLERSSIRGGWAVGTGNSVPEYLPPEALFAMHRAARDFTS